ncbi:MAG: diguanylate cyclase [Candidatus Omnitrophota bacterium]|jgi:PAS domain S-box-containing protein/diguanylate cyclase (GGDEF)-like protein|nr:MAG: diguanylate cyclase [Candidatus Omnitrophota bacterium]
MDYQQNEMIMDFYKTIMDYLDIGVYHVDRNRQIIYWNHGAELLTGYKREEIISKHCQDRLLEHVDEHGTCLCLELCPLAATIEDGQCRKANVFLHHKNGHRVPITVQTLPIKGLDGNISGAFEIFMDNPAKENESEKIKELAKLAFLDHNTNLPNQNYLMMKLKTILTEVNQLKCHYSAIMIRIDNYTFLCDTFTQAVVDRILNTAGITVHNNIPSTCILGRWDHQTFLIIVPTLSPKLAELLGKKLCRLIEQSTFSIQKMTVRSDVSFRCGQLQSAADETSFIEPILQAPYVK